MKIRKALYSFLLFLSVLAISSCSSTETFVSYPAVSDLSVEEKMEALGVDQMKVDYPEVYYYGPDFLERITDLVSQAKDYILITTFLGSSAPELEEFYSVLAEKAESGVRVYVSIDGLSSYDMTESRFVMTPLYFLKESGVNLIEYSPLTFAHVIAPQYMLLREHRKIFVIDGKISVIGGMNINYISLGSKEKNQRDSMYIFHSTVLAKSLTDQFVSIWNSSTVEKIDRDSFKTYENDSEGKIPAYMFNQGPGGKEKVADMYSVLINSAEKEILLFSFIPAYDENMLTALKNAKERGVRIVTVVSSEPRNSKGSFYAMPRVLEFSDEVYLTVSDAEIPLLHEKLMIVDGRYTVIGSTNFNFRSMALDNDISIVMDSEEFAQMSRDHFYDKIQDGAEHITEERAEELRKEGSAFSYFLVYYGG